MAEERGRSWPAVRLQPPDSGECELYANAYLTSLLGHATTPDDIRKWSSETHILRARYPEKVHGIRATWGVWAAMANLDTSIAVADTSGFREWVRAYVAHGCVGLTIMSLRPDYGHAVVILEADETGVLLADSCRGLVRDEWAFFAHPPNGAFPTWVEAWYRLPDGEATEPVRPADPPKDR